MHHRTVGECLACGQYRQAFTIISDIIHILLVFSQSVDSKVSEQGNEIVFSQHELNRLMEWQNLRILTPLLQYYFDHLWVSLSAVSGTA